jgi:hypothetical protein
MNNPKIYIAGKIGSLPESVYKANFDNAKHEVSERGFDPISPVDLPHNHERTWEAYMREDLIALLSCNAVYALDNWTDSPGATVEVELAIKVGIHVVYQAAQNWSELTEKQVI